MDIAVNKPGPGLGGPALLEDNPQIEQDEVSTQDNEDNKNDLIERNKAN